jgi:hypothetical protein
MNSPFLDWTDWPTSGEEIAAASRSRLGNMGHLLPWRDMLYS